MFVGEVTSPTEKHARKSSTSADTKEDEKPKKLIEDDETGKMIDVERSETGRVRSIRKPSGTLAKSFPKTSLAKITLKSYKQEDPILLIHPTVPEIFAYFSLTPCLSIKYLQIFLVLSSGFFSNPETFNH